jgi:uncharacterized protein
MFAVVSIIDAGSNLANLSTLICQSTVVPLALSSIQLYNAYMNQSSQLYQVQKIDTALDQTNARLAEITRIIESDKTVQTAQESVTSATYNLHLARRSLTTIEDAVKTIHIKIQTSEASLYGGKIRNPKELQDLQVETTSLKRRLAALEDEQLEAMLEVESAETELSRANKSLNVVKATFSSQQASLLGEQSQLSKIVERFQAERNATVQSILPENIDLYERLRKQKRGLAVVLIDDGACSGCGSSIRPAERQLARSPSQMLPCSSCGRILYAG